MSARSAVQSRPVARRLLNFGAILSLASYVLLAALAAAPARESPFVLRAPSADAVRAEVSDGKFSVFNRGLPYRGSIIGVRHGGPPHEITFDSVGIYFRYFRLTDASVWWTLTVPLAYPLVIGAASPVCWVVAWRRRTRAAAGPRIAGDTSVAPTEER
jgi:hypothetical protein